MFILAEVDVYKVFFISSSSFGVLVLKFWVVFMPPTSKKLRGHIGLGLSVQSVSQPVCLSEMREHSVRNR